MNFLKKSILFYATLFVILSAILIPARVIASDPDGNVPGKEGLVPCGSFSNDPCQLVDIFNLVIIVTNFMISLATIIAVFAIAFAGYSWIVAAGNIEAVTSAKKLLVNSVIGLFFVLAAFALANFLIWGGRALIRGEPKDAVKKTPVGIFVCPIDYILGNEFCGGSGDNNSNQNGNSNTNEDPPSAAFPPVPFDPTGEDSGITAGTDPGDIGCTTAVRLYWFIQEAGACAGIGNIFNDDASQGYLSGPDHNDFGGIMFQQDYANVPLGNPPSSNLSASGCAIFTLINAITALNNNGYNNLGIWWREYNERPENRTRQVSMGNFRSPAFWAPYFSKWNMYAPGKGMDHESVHYMLMDGRTIDHITADRVNNPSLYIDKINATLDRGGVVSIVVHGLPLTSEGHFMLVWKKYETGGREWFSLADSNRPRQIGQIRSDVLTKGLAGNGDVTLIYPY